tara:strand:+ start:1925 stop:2587 length:663 start_codon:yes stop_codon:yes gene_type:complete
MSVATKGNTTNSNQNPNGGSLTVAHNHNTGSDSLLVVQITMANTTNYSGVTYDGDSLTQLHNTNRSGLSQRMAFFYIQNPSTGSNDVVINFTGNQFNPISVHIRSFTGSGGVGNYERSGASATPNNKTIDVSDDSLIMVTSCSQQAILTQQIPSGTTRTFTTHNTNRQVATGAISSNAGHSAGTINLRATTGSGTVSLDRVEILGLGGSSSSNPDHIFVC